MGTITRIARVDVHPLLIVLPLGFFALSLLFDILTMLAGPSVWDAVAGENLAAGLVVEVVAVAAFSRAHINLHPSTRAKRTSATHLALLAASLVTFALSLALRGARVDGPTPSAAIALSVVALGTAAVGGWLGDELTRRGA